VDEKEDVYLSNIFLNFQKAMGQRIRSKTFSQALTMINSDELK
jgi:hypothetical protein